MWKRRSVLATGAAFSVGTGLASVGAGAAETAVDELPDPSLDPGPNEDWSSHRGGPGHAKYVADGHEFDGGALEAAWSVAGAGTGSVAVADETVYTPTEDGVVALDATDGTVVWENTDIDADAPSVAGETVYLSGNEIVALDRSDGTVRWETEFDPEEEIRWQTVAYGGVYAVVDGTLYALEADDGSVRWTNESVSSDDGEAYEFAAAPAAANGVIYSVTSDGPIALEPETGAEVWRTSSNVGSYTRTIHATSAAIAYDGGAYNEWPLRDIRTGELLSIGSGTREIAFGEEIYVGSGTDNAYGGGSIRGDDHSWSLDVMYTYGEPVISGETAFVYLTRDGGPPDPEWRDYDEHLVALNKYDGSEKWALSTDDAPVGQIRAISGETIYVDNDGELVALREETDTDDRPDEGDGNDDTDGGNDGSDGSDEGGDQQDGEDDSGEKCACPDDGSTDSRESIGGGDGRNGTAGKEGAGNEPATESDTGADDVPGFTTGTGLLGGALGLEWLRRKTDVDESTSVDEPSE